MTKPAAIFRACYSDWKLIRTRKCVQLVFEVPLEESNKAYEALGGMPNSGEEAWVAIARLNPETVKEVMPDISGNRFNDRPDNRLNDTQSREEVMPTESPRDINPVDTQSREEVMPDTPANQRANPNDKTQPREEVMPDKWATPEPPNDTSPASGPDIPARAHKKKWRELEPSQQAALLCKDKSFWPYVARAMGNVGSNEKDAATYVRNYCRVQSRSEIISGTKAGRDFDILYSNFISWRDADKYVEASA